MFRDDSTECYLAWSIFLQMFNVIGFPLFAHFPIDAFFTSGDFILYCYYSVQLAIARENFDFEEDVGLFNQRLYVLRCLIPSI